MNRFLPLLALSAAVTLPSAALAASYGANLSSTSIYSQLDGDTKDGYITFALPSGGTVTSFSYYALNAGTNIIPIIVKDTGGTFSIVAAGESVTSMTPGVQTATFNTIYGSDSLSAGDYFGFVNNDGSNIAFVYTDGTGSHPVAGYNGSTALTTDAITYIVPGAGGQSLTSLTFTPNGSMSENNVGGASYREYAVNATVTPEPSSLALLGTGLAGAAGMLRRRFSRAA